MVVVSPPTYDTQPALYIAYLTTVLCNGAGIELAERLGRQPDGGSSGGVLLDVGKRFSAIHDIVFEAFRRTRDSLGDACAAGPIDSTRGACAGSPTVGIPSPPPSLSPAGTDCVGSGVDRGQCTGGFRAPGLPPGGVVVVPAPGVGKNHAANVRKRENRRKRREAFEGRLGFFAEADEETRRQLRETRAKRLIAENQLAEERARLRVSKANGVASMVGEARRALDLEAVANKSQSMVGQWAKTVAVEAVREASSKAPSSVNDSLVQIQDSASQQAERRNRRDGRESHTDNVVCKRYSQKLLQLANRGVNLADVLSDVLSGSVAPDDVASGPSALRLPPYRDFPLRF